MLKRIVVLVLVCACVGQGPRPPSPQEALDVRAEMLVLAVNNVTGDVTIAYTLFFTNKSGEPLEKVVLKDFRLPADMAMPEKYFEITQMLPDEQRKVTFDVIIKGWGIRQEDKEWQATFIVRIEKGEAYKEQEFYYKIHLPVT